MRKTKIDKLDLGPLANRSSQATYTLHYDVTAAIVVQ